MLTNRSEDTRVVVIYMAAKAAGSRGGHDKEGCDVGVGGKNLVVGSKTG